MNGNGRRLAVFAAFLTLLTASGFAAAGNGNSRSTCNAGKGNGNELYAVSPNPDGSWPQTYNGLDNDCDPGNSGTHNHAGDYQNGLL